MSEIADFAYEKQTEINNLKEEVRILERQANRQTLEMVALRKKARERILSMKSEVRQEITAVKMILTAIKEGRSSHWQKKENIRLALEILETIPTFDRGEFLNYEDDF